MRSLNWKFILKVVGFILVLEALFLFLSSAVSFYFDGEDLEAMLLSGIITLAAGVTIALVSGIKNRIRVVSKHESYLSVALSWLLFALFGSLPFYLSGAIPSFTNAFFESVSGITTTGSSILDNIESMPRGLLFWRSLTQWLGGMGIIVFSLALLPLIGGSAAQLFDAEASGLTQEKFQPRVSQMAKRLWGIYMGLTLAVTLLYWAGPMSLYDAVCHGLTTISTGGFSTKQASLAYWDSTYLEGVAILFMLFGSINFVLIYYFFKGYWRKLWKNEEFRWFFMIIFVATAIITLGLTQNNNYLFPESLRYAFFQVVAIITTTGYGIVDFSSWGSFHLVVFLFLMVVCGCAGSTSGGLKTVRVVVLVKDTLAEFKRLVHPRAIIPVRLNGAALSFQVVQRLLAFVFLYIAIIFISWFILCLCGLGFQESLSLSVSAISNVGPAFGENLGALDSLNQFSDFVKWYLSFLMIVGRLEIFTVLILFTPGFWKNS